MKNLIAFASAAVVACITASGAFAAVITPLASFANFTSTTIFSNDFEAIKDTPQFSFDADAFLTSSAGVSGVTSSGVQLLARSQPRPQPPLNAFLTLDAFEVGMFFGNDIGTGPFLLSVFDAGNVLLGSVSVNGNGNDFADQFIGLRSDMAFRKVSIDYPDIIAARLIDDFTIGVEGGIGISVPEPGTLALFGLGLAGLGFARRKKTA